MKWKESARLFSQYSYENEWVGLGQLQQCNVERKHKEPKETIGYHLCTLQKHLGNSSRCLWIHIICSKKYKVRPPTAAPSLQHNVVSACGCVGADMIKGGSSCSICHDLFTHLKREICNYIVKCSHILKTLVVSVWMSVMSYFCVWKVSQIMKKIKQWRIAKNTSECPQKKIICASMTGVVDSFLSLVFQVLWL